MTIQELIDHLSQFDPNIKLKIVADFEELVDLTIDDIWLDEVHREITISI